MMEHGMMMVQDASNTKVNLQLFNLWELDHLSVIIAKLDLLVELIA